MTPDWPFSAAPTTETFITRDVLAGAPILSAFHEYFEDGWQFHGETDGSTEDAHLVALGETLSQDTTLREIAGLPSGWRATRAHAGGQWLWSKNHPYPTFPDDGYFLRVPPEGFPHLPGPADCRSLEPGDRAKLMFAFLAEDAIPEDSVCERMWVQITMTDSEQEDYIGSLANHPDQHRTIRFDDELTFNAEHIIAIQRKASS